MSTVKINTAQDRFIKLVRMNELILHIEDLANIWKIKNKNTLHTTLKRYVKKSFLYHIYRGFYSLDVIDKIPPYLLGAKALHEYCYISTESVLIKNGIVQQKENYITFVSSKSKKFKIGDNYFYSRQMNDQYLFQDVGIIKKDGVNMATTERAVADLLYFNPSFYFDANNNINWKEVKKIQKIIGYK